MKATHCCFRPLIIEGQKLEAEQLVAPTVHIDSISVPLLSKRTVPKHPQGPVYGRIDLLSLLTIVKDNLTELLSQKLSPPMRIRAVRVPVGERVEADVGKAGTPCFLSTTLLELVMMV